MQPELLTPEYDESEFDERAIRRSELIRKKYGTLANFLTAIAETKGESDRDQEGLDPDRAAPSCE